MLVASAVAVAQLAANPLVPPPLALAQDAACIDLQSQIARIDNTMGFYARAGESQLGRLSDELERNHADALAERDKVAADFQGGAALTGFAALLELARQPGYPLDLAQSLIKLGEIAATDPDQVNWSYFNEALASASSVIVAFGKVEDAGRLRPADLGPYVAGADLIMKASVLYAANVNLQAAQEAARSTDNLDRIVLELGSQKASLEERAASTCEVASRLTAPLPPADEPARLADPAPGDQPVPLLREPGEQPGPVVFSFAGNWTGRFAGPLGTGSCQTTESGSFGLRLDQPTPGGPVTGTASYNGNIVPRTCGSTSLSGADNCAGARIGPATPSGNMLRFQLTCAGSTETVNLQLDSTTTASGNKFGRSGEVSWDMTFTLTRS